MRHNNNNNNNKNKVVQEKKDTDRFIMRSCKLGAKLPLNFRKKLWRDFITRVAFNPP